MIEEDDLDNELEEPVKILSTGPFAGLPFPNESARANALHVVRECVSTYLITHPHLDHLSGFVVNTAGLASTSRPKRLAALPSTVNAIKAHIFNDIIWPNLTDEDGGVGFVTFQRLPQGGNNMVGEGPGKGYIEVCDGLCVKGMKVSHGHCMRGPHQTTVQAHRDSEVGLSEPGHVRTSFSGMESPRRDTVVVGRDGRARSITQLQYSVPGTPDLFTQQSASFLPPPTQSSSSPALGGADPMLRRAVVDSTAYFIRDDSTGREALIFGDVEPDLLSLNPRTAQVWAEAAPKIAAGSLRAVFIECSYDDSQNDAILFGHLAPRHLINELRSLATMVRARKQEERERREGRKRKRSAARAQLAQTSATGTAEADTSRPVTRSRQNMAAVDNTAPSSVATTDDENAEHLGANGMSNSPGKRRITKPPRLNAHLSRTKSLLSEFAPSPMDPSATPATPGFPAGAMGAPAPAAALSSTAHLPSPSKARVSRPTTQDSNAPPTAEDAAPATAPLEGLKVVIIHMKDTLRDGPLVGDSILKQLLEHEEKMKEGDGVGLGCEFVISRVGESYWV